MFSKLTIKTAERLHWLGSDVFIVHFEQISQIIDIFIVDFKQINAG